jgi:hypothetical protein
MTSILHTIVDHVVLLSMDVIKTRHMHTQFFNLGITEELFHAIPGKNIAHLHSPESIETHGINALGSQESYKRIMKKYYNSKAIALFEDDLILVDDFNEHLEIFLNEVPKTWDMLYFSGNHIKNPQFITKNVYRIFATWGVLGVIINKRIYDKINNYNENYSLPFDCSLHDLQRETETYCINPHVCYPYPSFSVVQQHFQYYNFFSPAMFR